MGLLEFTRQQTYTVHQCGAEGCGDSFAMTTEAYNRRLEKGTTFYCTNGHPRVFTDSITEKLKRELEAKKRDVEWLRAERNRADRKASAARGLVTKMKNRIGNGVCPCCNRSFINLKRHITHMHPDFKKPPVDQL